LKKLRVEELRERPCYVFTSDIDWADEAAIKRCLEAHRGVPLTPFITHKSPAIEAAYSSQPQHVGVHPNFRLESTHGDHPSTVIEHVKRLWDTRFYRCHGFYEDTNISVAMKENGYMFNSNLALHLQDYSIPLRHQSGATIYPVTLEDDYLLRETGINWGIVKRHLESPGLKVLNFHPIHVALNTPSLKYYESVKPLLTVGNWREHIYRGEGIAGILKKSVEYVKDSPGLGAYYLDDLHGLLSNGDRDKQYRSLNGDGRAESVRQRYEKIDNLDIYATSRDRNLRELEVDYILGKIHDGDHVLDLGCGNGYTDVRIAKAYDVNVTALDISENMITGAKALAEKNAPLRGRIDFRVQDCRRIPFESAEFDAIVTERFLLNLPDPSTQINVIREIHRVLKPGGIFIMVEGSLDGLENLNKLREKVGLNAIPNRSEDNVSAIKFRERDLEANLAPMFKIRDKKRWSTYYLISRVVHPLLVAPAEPRWASPINAVARAIQEVTPDDRGALGHVVGYTLVKRREAWLR
jgi:ubiquinone/menaquinone biosynthesis C-methylase UbiE